MRLLTMMSVALVMCVGLPKSLLADQIKAPPSTAPVYDESANATQDIAAAVRRAGFENQRVLLDIGGNWCHWCTLLHNLFEENQDVKTLLRSEYQVVNVDIGNGTGKNADLLAGYGIKPISYPYLAILGPDNKRVVQQETGAL